MNQISKILYKIAKLFVFIAIIVAIIWAISLIHFHLPTIHAIHATNSNKTTAIQQRSIVVQTNTVVRVGVDDVKIFDINERYGKWISINPACRSRYTTDTPKNAIVRFQYRNGRETKWLMPNEYYSLKDNTFRCKTKSGKAKLTIVTGKLGSIKNRY